jgi:hypothetical protein
VFLATVDSLPQPYEIVGMVHASERVAAGYSPMGILLDVLADQAAGMGADGVIGIRMSEVSVPGMSRERFLGRVTDHYGGVITATALGTAVRLLGTASPGRPTTRARAHAG